MPVDSKIHIVCALKCEAVPLLDYFKLEHQDKDRLFNSYFNEDNGISLTLTGIGKLNAAAGTMHAVELFGAQETDVWLNIGIAGHGTMPVGSAALANRITDSGSGSRWFPQMLIDLPVPSRGLITVDTPSSVYNDEMIDMEAAGYYASAVRVGTSELIHCLKIISDNKQSPPDSLRRNQVSAMIGEKIHHINMIIEQLRELTLKLPDSSEQPAHYRNFTDNWHFSEYQKIRLRSLLNRWRVIKPDQNPMNDSARSKKSGTAVLDYLEQELDSFPVDYPVLK